MTPLNGLVHAEERQVSPTTDLKEVLQQILKSELDSVIVTDEQGATQGRITLSQLKIREEAAR